MDCLMTNNVVYLTGRVAEAEIEQLRFQFAELGLQLFIGHVVKFLAFH